MIFIPPSHPPQDHDDWLHSHLFRGFRLHHLILTVIFIFLVALGVYFISSESTAIRQTAITSYQQTELVIVQDAARSTREYVYVQTMVLNRTDIPAIEQEVFRKFIEPIHLQKNGDAWIYAPDHVVFDLSADFPDNYRNKSMAQIFAIQKEAGASHYDEMSDAVMHSREGVGYYIWLPEKGEEIAAWTPVTVSNLTWTIGISTPLSEILDETGAAATTRTSARVFVAGVSIATALFVAWLIADIRRGKSEAILRESEERYSAIVSNTPSPVVIIRTGEIVYINNAGVRSSGFMPEELTGHRIIDFLTPNSKKTLLDAMQRRSSGQEQISEYEVGFIRKDGTVINLIVRAIDITYQGETVTLALLSDITDLKRAEEATRMANKKLNLLTGITRHDIRNKLLILAGYIELSRQSVNDPGRAAELIKKERDTVSAISSLISFTKDYETLGIRAPAWQNVSSIIRTILPQLPLRDVRVEPCDPTLEIFADPMLGRVYYNLIENALRYGGEQMNLIRITSRSDGDNLILAIEDNGTGISPVDKSSLFTKGFGKNTGLGLFLSREILSITGITISENGEPGAGTRFEMRIPKDAWRLSEK